MLLLHRVSSPELKSLATQGAKGFWQFQKVAGLRRKPINLIPGKKVNSAPSDNRQFYLRSATLPAVVRLRLAAGKTPAITSICR